MASAAACSLTCFGHILEMNTLRGWSVAVLAFVAAGTSRSNGLLLRTVVVTVRGSAPQAFAYSRRKPSPQRLIWPTEGDGKCIVQHNVSVSQ
jgi:hypothetical protein